MSTYVSYQTHFHININFVMLIHGDIDNIAGSRFEFWRPSWIPVVVGHMFHDFFVVLSYCAHILKNSCWYPDIDYTCTERNL